MKDFVTSPSVEHVHQLRVTIRRLQAALRLMRLTRQRRAFRPLMQLAGQVRNRDIAMTLVDEAARAPLEAERQHWAAALASAAREFTPPPVAERPAQLPPKMLKRFFAAGRRAARQPSAAQLHALRLAGKRLRYAIEYLAPGLDSSTPQRLRELKAIQDELGEANDCATTRTLTGGQEFHAQLQAKEAEHHARFAALWRESFGVLGAWESWRAYLAPVTRGKRL